MDEKIIQRLKTAIKALGVTQKVFAEKSGVSASFVTEILKGRTTPSDRVVREMCRNNGLSEKWLLAGEGPMRPEQDGYGGADPELATLVTAELQKDYRAGSMTLSKDEAMMVEFLRDLPDDLRVMAMDNLHAIWLGWRRSEKLSK